MTKGLFSCYAGSCISTHTPLARRDGGFLSAFSHRKFLLTRLSRGVTEMIAYFNQQVSISTHTPLARRDDEYYAAMAESMIFLLTRLSRGVTDDWCLTFSEVVISTHTPLARRDGRNAHPMN